MNLVEQHIIDKNHILFNYCDTICFQSKNLYNLASYYIKQEFLNNNKYLDYNKLDKMLQSTEAYKFLQSKKSRKELRLFADLKPIIVMNNLFIVSILF